MTTQLEAPRAPDTTTPTTAAPRRKRPLAGLVAALVAVAAAVGITVAVTNDDGDPSVELTTALASIQAAADLEASEQANLDNFDDLDFSVFTGQRWDELNRSHADDIIVHWPDGRSTEGIDVHIEDLEAMFVWAPDTNIVEHPIRIAQGNMTAVTGIMRGTFTEPMPVGGGEFIEPTGQSYEIMMATIGRWEDGTMVEEWLFWDNQTFLQQIGLTQ
jgi:hypothetical protein